MGAVSETLDDRDARGTANAVARLYERVRGFDFFISHAHADAPGYAEQLDQHLRALGFKTFLDRREYVAGDDLSVATLQRVRASSKLVVVVGERALQSHWVGHEVEAAIAAGRPVIAIDLFGDLATRPEQTPPARLLRDRIHVRDPGGLQAAAPAGEALDALTRSFQATRRQTLHLRLALAGILFFAGLAGYSYWQKHVADERAAQYLEFCNRVVGLVRAGNKKIDDLRISEFGSMIADVTETLAQLPDPETDPDLRCIPTAGWPGVIDCYPASPCRSTPHRRGSPRR